MGNRSNINLVGNTTFGENVGTGTGVYKGKNLGNVLQLKTLSVTGTTMTITSDAENIYFSAATGGGGGTVVSGTACRVPVFNTAGDNVEDTTLAFSANTLCNSNCLIIRSADSDYMYLDAPNTGSNHGIVYLGAPDTAANITSQRLYATGLATNVSMQILPKGSGGVSILTSCLSVTPLGPATGGWVFTSTGFRVPQTNGKIHGYGGDSGIPDACPICVVGGNGNGTSNSGYGGDVCLIGGNAASSLGANCSGGTVVITAGAGINAGVSGRVRMTNLPVKSSETCGIYIDGSGNLSTGLISGGSGGSSAGVSGDTQFSDGSSGFVVTNSGIARNVDLGSYVLGVSNIVSGTTYSLILGESNVAHDTYESFIGGYFNCQGGGGFFPGLDLIYGENNCDMSSGYGNQIFGSYNCFCKSNTYSMVGGYANFACCSYASLIFGDTNCLLDGGSYDIMLGNQNCITGSSYGITIGDNNILCSDFAYILGSYNTIEECSWNSTALNWNNCVCYCVRGAMAHGNRSVAEVAHERTTGAGSFYFSEPNLLPLRSNTREINLFHQTTGTTDTRDLLTYYCHHANPATRQYEYFCLTSGSTLAFKAQIVGQRLSDGLSGTWFIEGAVKRNIANNVSFIGTPTVTCYIDGGFTGCACVCANNTDKRLDLSVTGMTSTTIGWSGTIYGTQVTKS